MTFDREPRAAQHRFDAGAIGYPPVGGIVRITMFDEVQLRKSGTVEQLGGPEIVIPLHRLDGFAAALHRLKHEYIARDVLMNEIEREQRVAQVIEHTHEDHEIEPFAERTNLVNREIAKFDIE